MAINDKPTPTAEFSEDYKEIKQPEFPYYWLEDRVNNPKVYIFDGPNVPNDIATGLRVGITYFNLKRSVLTPAASLTIKVPSIQANGSFLYSQDYDMSSNIKIGNMIAVEYYFKRIFTGYIVKIKKEYDANGSTIDIECKDPIWRLQKCQLNHLRGGLNGNLPLSKIVKWALDGMMMVNDKGFPDYYPETDFFGQQIQDTGDYKIQYNQIENLKVTTKPSDADLNTDFEAIKEQDVKPKQNENLYSFLTRLIKPHGYILQADVFGSLMFYRPNNKETPRFEFYSYDSEDIEQTIFNANLEIDLEELYSQYYIFSNTSGKNKTTVRNFYNYTNPAYPENAVKNVLVQYDENMKSKAQCEKLAKRKCGFGLAKYWNYTFEIKNFEYPENGGAVDRALFSNDIVIMVYDYETLSEDLKPLYVTEIEFTQEGDSQKTIFTCTVQDALVLE